MALSSADIQGVGHQEDAQAMVLLAGRRLRLQRMSRADSEWPHRAREHSDAAAHSMDGYSSLRAVTGVGTWGLDWAFAARGPLRLTHGGLVMRPGVVEEDLLAHLCPLGIALRQY